jgi:hypothetical protein
LYPFGKQFAADAKGKQVLVDAVIARGRDWIQGHGLKILISTENTKKLMRLIAKRRS